MESAQVIACSKVITLHLLNSRQPTNLYSPHKGLVNCVHINHTNKVIASCGQDGRIVLVNALKPDNQVFETSFHLGSNSLRPVSVNCIMFSSSSHYIAAGSSDCLVKIWDMKNHKQVFSTIKSHVGSVTSLAWIKNSGLQKIHGQILASSSSVGDIFLHSVKTNNIVQTLNVKNQQQINQIKVTQSEGHCRLAACTHQGSVMVWNIRNLQKDTNPLYTFNNGKKSAVTSVSFSSFNPVLLASSSLDENLTFFDINEKKSVKVIACQEPLTSINFHSDGHTLVAGGMHGGLFVYDLRKPTKPKEKLLGHDTAIKQSLIIKQYEPTPTVMGASRTSKTSSVSSYASSNIPSSKSIKQEDEGPSKQIKQNNYVNEKNQSYEQLGIRSDSINMKNDRNLQNKRENIKLSATGQQIIKNSELRNINTVQTMYSKPTQPPSNPSIPPYNKPLTILDTKTQNTNQTSSRTKISQNQTISVSPLKQIPRSNNPTKSSSFSIQNNQTIQNQSSSRQIKDLIEQKFENFHMELIRQFHIQQMEIKEMVTTLLIEDKKKTQKIKELENQINNLKHHTY